MFWKVFLLFMVVVFAVTCLAACLSSSGEEDHSSDIESSEVSGVESSETSEMEISSGVAESSEVVDSSSKVDNTQSSLADSSQEYVARPKNPEKLSDELENKIKEDWFYKLNSESSIDYNDITMINDWTVDYFGTYNNCVAVMIWGSRGVDGAERDITIDDVVFHYRDGNRMEVWKDGNFLKLADAFEQGLLTREDIQDIEYYYRTGSPLLRAMPKYSLTKREAALEGKSVSFTNGDAKVTVPYEYYVADGFKPHLLVIKSMDDLNVVKEKISGFSAEYDSEFFGDNALIVAMDIISSISYEIESVSLVKDNGELCIERTMKGPKNGIALGAIKEVLHVFEVKRADLSDVKTFSLYEKWGEVCSSGI